MPPRRRETSRHRSRSRFAPPARVTAALRVAAVPLSIVLPLVALGVVQSLSPAAQRVPTGAGRYDLAAAWASTAPGALAGLDPWSTAPVLARLQLGLLLRALGAGEAQTVLAAAHGAMLLLALIQAALLWWLLRRAGAGTLAAGAATAVFCVTPLAVETHAAVSASPVAAVWALLAGALAARARGSAAAWAASGASAVLSIASAPVLAAPVIAAAAVLVAVRRPGRRSAGAALIGAAVVVAAVVGTGLLVGALPRADTGRALAAIDAAQGGPVLGGALLASWWRVDPLLLVVAVIALLLLAAVREPRWAAPFVVALLTAVWPLGGDPVTGAVLVLPAFAVVLARSLDLGVDALLDPRFIRSVLGSGWLTGVAAVLVVAAVAWIGGLPALVRGGDQPIARVDRWLAAGVPDRQTVLVGLGAWPDLSRTSRAVVGWYAGGAAQPSSVPWSRADYVVTDSSLPAKRTGAAAAALGRSLEVARYGSGAAAMEVRAIAGPSPSPSVTAPTTAAERAALADREQIGAQLAKNPRLGVDGAGRARLLGGRVDTKVAIVLAQFMTEHRITVDRFTDEDSAGVHHGVTVSEVDGARIPAAASQTGMLLRFLSELSGDLATRSIDAGARGVTATFG